MTVNPETAVNKVSWKHHIEREDWLMTPDGTPRGYIQPETLSELWFHTGTKCNLGCWFCLEESGPKANRIEAMTFEEARLFMDEALRLGVEQFSFTGGEPFVNDDMVKILDYALDHKPCLVLTNGTLPLKKRFDEVAPLVNKPHSLKFRISLDFPDPKRHDEARGKGNFAMALKSLKVLFDTGFQVSVARHREAVESNSEVDDKFREIFSRSGLPANTNIISFPELHRPGEQVEVPPITENCMTTYKDEESRSQFMCNYSKMIVKIAGRLAVYACTLVDDDHDYAFGKSLDESMNVRVMLKHHRCFSCFSAGTSCSEK